MRKIILLLFFGIVFPAHAYELHIGENIHIPIHSIKYTIPSICFLINNDVNYIPLTTKNIVNTLHIEHNNKTYSACIGEQAWIDDKLYIGECLVATRGTNSNCSGDERWNGDHLFVGNCLVGIKSNVYLEGTGTQYINSNISVSQPDVISYTIDGIFYNDAGSWNGADFFIQINTATNNYKITQNNHTPLINKHTGNRDVVNVSWDGDYTAMMRVNDILVDEIQWGGSYANDICLFALCQLSNISISGPSHTRIYSAKIIRDDNTTVRHMVPVPAGLRIGDYVVPANGMWDIVEQKFYGNSGTGDFIYGVDE